MTLYDYKEGQVIASKGYGFYGLLQAVIRQADSDNLVKLEKAFPNEVSELRRRYNAPGGRIPEDDIPRLLVITEDKDDKS